MNLSPGRLVLTWIALLALIGVTLGLAYLPLGAGNAAALAVSVAMASLVLGVFMRLPKAPPLAVVFALGGLFWVAVMFCLAGADYLSRTAHWLGGGPPAS